MMQNSSFETRTTEPENWSNTTSTLFTWEQTDPTKLFTGSKSVKIANPVGLWAGYQSTEFIPYEAGKKYTLTGLVKTENVTNPSEVYIIKVGYEYNAPAENYVTKITDQIGYKCMV